MRGTVQETLRQYAHELGLNTPIATTTVKPSGTVSLLCGSSPGVHAPYANFYIRRTRLAEHEPMAKALLSAGVPFEHAHDDSRALLFTFPSRHSATTTVQNETTRDQLQRQLDVQTHWADNAVSATVTFEGAVHRPDGSLDEGPTQDNLRNLAALMKEYIPQVKSTSFLARSHGYAQPPYEPISEERYHELVKGINMSHPLTKGGDMEVDECSNGACPIR
jgi:ribonucleoside-diphosphate reductase alpha chain